MQVNSICIKHTSYLQMKVILNCHSNLTNQPIKPNIERVNHHKSKHCWFSSTNSQLRNTIFCCCLNERIETEYTYIAIGNEIYKTSYTLTLLRKHILRKRHDWFKQGTVTSLYRIGEMPFSSRSYWPILDIQWNSRFY